MAERAEATDGDGDEQGAGEDEQTDYDVGELYEAYAEHTTPHDDPFCPWSQFKESYGDDARAHFVEALNGGDIEVVETKHGIRGHGHWPNLNKGMAWLEFHHPPTPDEQE